MTIKNPATLSLVILLAMPFTLRAQFGGGAAAYSSSGARARAEQTERAKRTIVKDDLPPSSTSCYVDASVLMNVKADEYVVVFAISREGKDVGECQQKMDDTIRNFNTSLKALGVEPDDVFVDFIAQAKTYGFQIEGNIAREKLVGFELKKNVSIHFTDKGMLDKFTAAAAKADIFDLVKVDYVVKDLDAVKDKLMAEAARIVKQKASRQEHHLGIKLIPPMQVLAERQSAYFPSEMYDGYTAAETEDISANEVRQKYTVQGARKGRTFYFNGLDAGSFDAVIQPVITEPVVQFTLYLKVRYEIEQPKAK